jgi:hypothetical protein
MVVRRTTFVLGVFFLVFFVLTGSKLVWLMRSKQTTGYFAFQGRGNALEQIRLPFSEIYYRLGNDTVWFRGPGKLNFKSNTPVTVWYQPGDPTDAKLGTFFGLWGNTAVYGGIILLVVLAVFIHPGIVPRHARLRLSYKKPFIQIV